MDFQFRITKPWTDVSGVIQLLVADAVQALAYEHPQGDLNAKGQKVERTHIHVYVFQFTRKRCKEDTLRGILKSQCDVSGEDFFFSLASGTKKAPVPLDISGATLYGSKGKYAPIFNKNISPAIVEEGKTRWVNIPKSEKSDQQKLDLYIINEEIEAQFLEHFTVTNVTPFGQTIKKIEYKCECTHYHHFDMVFDIAIKVLKKHRKRWNTPDIERYILPVLMPHCRESQIAYKHNLKNKIFGRI